MVVSYVYIGACGAMLQMPQPAGHLSSQCHSGYEYPAMEQETGEVRALGLAWGTRETRSGWLGAETAMAPALLSSELANVSTHGAYLNNDRRWTRQWKQATITNCQSASLNVPYPYPTPAIARPAALRHQGGGHGRAHPNKPVPC